MGVDELKQCESLPIWMQTVIGADEWKQGESLKIWTK